jgi:hypothetical protein
MWRPPQNPLDKPLEEGVADSITVELVDGNVHVLERRSTESRSRGRRAICRDGPASGDLDRATNGSAAQPPLQFLEGWEGVLNLCERLRPSPRRSVDKQLRNPCVVVLWDPDNPANQLAIEMEVVTARGELMEGIRHHASSWEERAS